MTRLSFPEAYPALISEWSPRNTIDPASLTYGSTHVVWWRCERGHEWKSALKKRTIGNQQCPICSNRRILVGYNDLATRYPDIALEWDESNPNSPQRVFPSSKVKVKWTCIHCSHQWIASPVQRTSGKQTGCPNYHNHYQEVKNNLTLTHPNLLLDWDDERPPTAFTCGSTIKVQWRCAQCSHGWTSEIRKRAQRNQGCPQCAETILVQGKNDLASQYPELVKEWSTENTLRANEVFAMSNNAALWIGDCGHKWKARIANRTAKKSGCPVCAGKLVLLGDNDLATVNPSLALEWSPKNTLNPNEVTRGASTEKIIWICTNGHEWRTTVKDRQRFGCPHCAHNISQAETDIFNTLCQQGIVVERNNRKVIAPKEIDLYLPEHKMGIEFNGLYWHSEQWKTDRNFHHAKWQAAANKRIQLLQIWEDDWLERRTLVTQMLLRKVGVSCERKVNARDTQIVQIDTATAKSFLTQHHIQGFANGTLYLGLIEKTSQQEVIAVMVLLNQGDDLLLSRYATSAIIRGGFTKLVKYVERTENYARIVTFADLAVSDGSIYKNNGWVEDAFLKPDYSYVVNGRREHKFKYRLKKFRSDPHLKWQEGLTENELAQLNGLSRIWDAGKLRYVKTHPDCGKIQEEK